MYTGTLPSRYVILVIQNTLIFLNFLCKLVNRDVVSVGVGGVITYAGYSWQPTPQGQVIRVTELK
jgi:hypothetical protein